MPSMSCPAFNIDLKTKNFHWSMSRPNFHDFHIMLDKQAEQIHAPIDPLVERVRKPGGSTIKWISHICEMQFLEDNGDFATGAKLRDEYQIVPPSAMLIGHM